MYKFCLELVTTLYFITLHTGIQPTLFLKGSSAANGIILSACIDRAHLLLTGFIYLWSQVEESQWRFLLCDFDLSHLDMFPTLRRVHSHLAGDNTARPGVGEISVDHVHGIVLPVAVV